MFFFPNHQVGNNIWYCWCNKSCTDWWRWSHNLQGLLPPRWCGISAINSMSIVFLYWPTISPPNRQTSLMCNLHVGHSWRISSVGKNPGPNQEPEDSGRILNRCETHGWLIACFIKYPDSAMVTICDLVDLFWFFTQDLITCSFVHMYYDSFYPGFNNLFILPYVKKVFFCPMLFGHFADVWYSQKLRASQAVGL